MVIEPLDNVGIEMKISLESCLLSRIAIELPLFVNNAQVDVLKIWQLIQIKVSLSPT